MKKKTKKAGNHHTRVRARPGMIPAGTKSLSGSWQHLHMLDE